MGSRRWSVERPPRSKSQRQDDADESKSTNKAISINQTEQVKAGIRQCLVRIEPAIFAYKRPPNIETALAFLEDMDEGAGGCDAFRGWLMTSLEASMRSMVRAEVQQQCRETRLTPEKMKMVAPAILSKILETNEMKSCVDSLQMAASSTAMNMCNNFEYELVLLGQLRGKDNHGGMGMGGHRESDMDSLGSSTGSNFAFMQTGQFARLAEQLNPYMGPESRIEALKLMLVSQFCDVVGSPEWKQIKEGLRIALIESQTPAVSSLALKVHARMMGNMTPFCTKEAFVNIVDTLLRIYKDKTRSSLIPVQGSEISFKKKSHSNLLHIYKLLVLVCRDIPRFWIRYPESYVTEIVKSMLDLASYSEARQRRGPAPLMPIDFISMVDPEAKWLQSWLHGKFGRTIVFYETKQCTVILKSAIQGLAMSLDVQKQSSLLAARGSTRGKGLVTVPLQAYSSFVYNLNVSTRLMMYRKSKDLLANPNDESAAVFPVESIVATWASHVCHSTPKSQQSSASLITQSIVKLLEKTHIVQGLMRNKQFVKTIFFPLILWEEEIKSKRKDMLHPQTPKATATSHSILGNVLTMILQILDNPSGLEAMLKNVLEPKRETTLSDFLIHLTTQAFVHYQSLPQKNAMLLLQISNKILLNHAGSLSKILPNFVDILSESFGDLDYQTSSTPTNSGQKQAVGDETYNKSLLTMIATVFASILATPRGCLVVSRSPILDSLMKQLSGKARLGSDQFSIILQHLSLTKQGGEAINELGFIEQELASIHEAAGHEKSGHAMFSHPSPEQMEEAVYSSVQNICSLLTSLNTVNHAMNNAFFQTIVTLNRDALSCSYVENDYALALQIILSAVAAIDTGCVLLQRFNAVEHVKSLEADYDASFSEPIVDKVSMYYRFILAFVRSIGGEGEKSLPSLTLEQVENPDTTKDQVKDCDGQLAVEPLEKLLKFIKDNSDQAPDWPQKLKDYINDNILFEHLEHPEQITAAILDETLNKDQNELSAPFSAKESFKEDLKLTPEQEMAAQLFTKYRPEVTADALRSISSFSLGIRDGTDSQSLDWFAVIILAICQGNAARCEKILAKFWSSNNALFLWPKKSGNLACLLLSHHIEIILQEEYPIVYQTVLANGLAFSSVVHQWWSQLFLNTLNWSQICQFVGIVANNGCDFIVYFCVALFAHLEQQILKFRIGSWQHDKVELLFLLKVSQVKDFEAHSYFAMMKKLQHKYNLSLYQQDLDIQV